MNHVLRTLPPEQVQPLADAHDASILKVFAEMFAIPDVTTWNTVVHGAQHHVWIQHSQLPIRMGGMGLRNSRRTSPAAYWASWADVLHSIVVKHPTIGRNMLYHLTAAYAGSLTGPQCIQAAEQSGILVHYPRMERTAILDRAGSRSSSPRPSRIRRTTPW